MQCGILCSCAMAPVTVSHAVDATASGSCSVISPVLASIPNADGLSTSANASGPRPGSAVALTSRMREPTEALRGIVTAAPSLCTTGGVDKPGRKEGVGEGEQCRCQ